MDIVLYNKIYRIIYVCNMVGWTPLGLNVIIVLEKCHKNDKMWMKANILTAEKNYNWIWVINKYIF